MTRFKAVIPSIHWFQDHKGEMLVCVGAFSTELSNKVEGLINSRCKVKTGLDAVSRMSEESHTSDEERGLLTDSERAAIAGDRSESQQQRTRSQLKSRIEKVGHDADLLAEHAPDLLDDLRAAVSAEVWRAARESSQEPSSEQTSDDSFDINKLEGNPENTIDDDMSEP